MNIIDSSAHMKLEPTETSPLETECLFGETIEIIEENTDWVYCRLDTDNYHGWINKKSFGKSINPTHRVITNRSFVYTSKNPKSNCLLYLPLGAKLLVNKIEFEWAQVSLQNKETEIGYVPSCHIVSLNHKVRDWVTIAELLFGIPYRWGGRDTIGIDCSALLQLSYQTYGEEIPRNTSEQIKLKKKYINDVKDLKRGCVVFWKGHVGIMTDKVNCIHANAYYMKTVTEPLFEIINRMKRDHQIIKMMDFN